MIAMYLLVIFVYQMKIIYSFAEIQMLRIQYQAVDNLCILLLTAKCYYPTQVNEGLAVILNENDI